MGHRERRKRERRLQQRHPNGTPYEGWPAEFGAEWKNPLGQRDEDLAAIMSLRPVDEYGRPTGPTCATCRDFVETQEAGRGECLHPGSGILFPWTDTASCDFHTGRRR